MLTGNNEPQQNLRFLQLLSQVNQSLRTPFLNIEMQTSGAMIRKEQLSLLKSLGVTTIAISVACIDSDRINREITQTADKDLNIRNLCRWIKELNMNLRICLNMNDFMVSNVTDPANALDSILARCSTYGADQITCRALWTSEDGTPQAKWIKENVTDFTFQIIDRFKDLVKEDGRYLDTLEYGADRYDYLGFSVVIDEDSMAQEINKDAVKYLILRPNGHLYSKWDSKASLIF